MQIRPGQQVYITYLIPNPSDPNTYFPQAVVKNTMSQAIIATVNLTQDPTQPLRYVGSFTAPGDSVGNGYFMDSVAIPYTDSGHTTPSRNYGAEQVTYFAWQPPPYYGGGDAVLIDYDKVGALMDERLAMLPKPDKIKFPKFPNIPQHKETDLAPVLTQFGPVMDSMKELHGKVDGMPQTEKVDLRPVMQSLASVAASVSALLKDHSAAMKKQQEDMMNGSMKEWDVRFQKMAEKALAGVSDKLGERIDELGHSGIPITMMSYRNEGQSQRPTKPVPSSADMMRSLSKKP